MDNYHFYLIFALVCIPLIRATFSDIRTRKVPISTWWPAVYLAMPLSLIFYGLEIMRGNIDVSDPAQLFSIFYSLFIILLMYIISNIGEKYIKIIKMGGADFIAVTIIIITSMPIGIYLPLVYMIIFIITSIITIIISLYMVKIKKVANFTIPLIAPASLSYCLAVPLYIAFGPAAFGII
jgi:hypothetical protein